MYNQLLRHNALQAAIRRSHSRNSLLAFASGPPKASLMKCQVRGFCNAMAPAPGADLPICKSQHGEYDVAVVGGGIIGMATANEVLRRFPAKTVVVIEKEPEVAKHQSGHNSGVIHGGMYYKPGTVMAKCCVDGAAMIYDYAEKKGIPYKRIGKLICAPTKEGHAMVEKLYHQGTTNGVKDLKIVYRDEIQKIEPNVDVYSALSSPNTGIIDFGDVTRSLAKDLMDSGQGTLHLNFEVNKVEAVRDEKTGSMKVEIKGTEKGQKGPTNTIFAKNVITCGGLQMDILGRICGGEKWPQVMNFRGTYWQMKPEYRNIVKQNIYPVPSGGAIPVGVHFTPTIGGYRQENMIVGPGATMTFAKEGYNFFDFSAKYVLESITNIGFLKFGIFNPRLSIGELYKDLSKRAFLNEARQLVPRVTDEMVEPSFCGVMAQVFMPDGKAASDYIFERKVVQGTTLNLRNAPTPAATSSMAIARELVDRAQEDFEWKE